MSQRLGKENLYKVTVKIKIFLIIFYKTLLTASYIISDGLKAIYIHLYLNGIS